MCQVLPVIFFGSLPRCFTSRTSRTNHIIHFNRTSRIKHTWSWKQLHGSGHFILQSQARKVQHRHSEKQCELYSHTKLSAGTLWNNYEHYLVVRVVFKSRCMLYGLSSFRHLLI